MRSMVVVVALASVAYADDVNLLKSTPTTIAVSSTVANAAILPDHLVDGKLSTAWNSQTGELAGAWIAVRVPADARVKTIKLTAGFAHKQKKADYFTMNPRIAKVRVTQAGKVLVEKKLDVDNRGLQEIPVDIGGGEFEVRVVDVVPGTKKNWRETCVSELEVWGTVPKVVKSKPSVRIRSLDAPPTLTREQCIKAVFPDRQGEVIGAVEAIPLADDLVVCRVDHKEKGATSTTTEIGAVKRTSAKLIAKFDESTTTEDRPNESTGDTGSVQLEVFPLTVSEKGLLVHVTQAAYGPMFDGGTTKSKLYRVSATAMDEVLAFESRWSKGEADDVDRCELAAPALRKTMPNLVLECVEERGHWHDENPDDRGTDTTPRTERYRWANGKYEPK